MQGGRAVVNHRPVKPAYVQLPHPCQAPRGAVFHSKPDAVDDVERGAHSPLAFRAAAVLGRALHRPVINDGRPIRGAVERPGHLMDEGSRYGARPASMNWRLSPIAAATAVRHKPRSGGHAFMSATRARRRGRSCCVGLWWAKATAVVLVLLDITCATHRAGGRPGGAACGLGNMVVTHLEPVSAILHPHTHEAPPLPVPRDAAGHRSSRPPPFQSGACPRKKHEDALYGDFEVWGS